MKANLTLHNGKIKVGLGNKEEHPITVTMSREVFAKIIANCLSKRSNQYDIRDFNEQQWREFDEKLRELRSENYKKSL